MTPEQIEVAAQEILEASGLITHSGVPIGALTERALGMRPIRVPPNALPADAALVTVKGQRRVYYRSDLPTIEARFAIAHELGHWALELDGSDAVHEDWCDLFAAAILAPPELFRRHWVQRELPRVAETLKVSQSCCALRAGEVLGEGVKVVTRLRVRSRGPTMGVPVKARITDAPNRFALFFAA